MAQELRCSNCRRKLGAAEFTGRIEIVCHRCGVFNTFKNGVRVVTPDCVTIPA